MELFLGGYASQNKYGLLGSVRATAQVISYEVALTLAVVSMIISYGSIHLTDIVNAQGGTIFGVIPAWGILFNQLAAINFYSLFFC